VILQCEQAVEQCFCHCGYIRLCIACNVLLRVVSICHDPPHHQGFFFSSLKCQSGNIKCSSSAPNFNIHPHIGVDTKYHIITHYFIINNPQLGNFIQDFLNSKFSGEKLDALLPSLLAKLLSFGAI